MDLCEKAFHENQRAYHVIDKLVALRKEQALTEKVRNVNYESLLAPFHYRSGDSLLTYILLNTDELGTVRPFQEESDSENEGEDAENNEGAEGGEAAQEETKQEVAAPEEESKDEVVAPTTMMINTMGDQGGSAAPKDANAGQEEEENYEQESLNYLSLAMQIISDFSTGENLLEDERAQRKKIMCFLEIDTLLSRV